LDTFLISIVVQIKLLAETVLRVFGGTAGRGNQISVGHIYISSSKAMAAAVISQTSMNLGYSDGLVKNRHKKSQKHQDDAFARILAGKLAPAAHPFGLLRNTLRQQVARLLEPHGDQLPTRTFSHPCPEEHRQQEY